MMRSILMMRMKKLTVDDLLDEQDLRIDYKVTADSMEQIEAKQYPCDECEYNVQY